MIIMDHCLKLSGKYCILFKTSLSVRIQVVNIPCFPNKNKIMIFELEPCFNLYQPETDLDGFSGGPDPLF